MVILEKVMAFCAINLSVSEDWGMLSNLQTNSKVVSQTIVVVHVFKIKHKKICETQRLEERLVHVIIIITSSQPWQLCQPT